MSAALVAEEVLPLIVQRHGQQRTAFSVQCFTSGQRPGGEGYFRIFMIAELRLDGFGGDLRNEALCSVEQCFNSSAGGC
ncbi:hypothetical protein HRbin30_02794 [bacterium HR30]|nr:hypothetical protein HRbin30_02794 [bacterium HR30]